MLFGVDIGYDLTDDGTLANLFLKDKLRTGYISTPTTTFSPSAWRTPYASVPTVELKGGTSAGGENSAGVVVALGGATAGLRGGHYHSCNGTSMATPHVAGAAAQLLASHPAASIVDKEGRLLDKGDALTSHSGKTAFGKRLDLAGAMDTAGAPAFTAVSTDPSTFYPNGDGSDGITILGPDHDTRSGNGAPVGKLGPAPPWTETGRGGVPSSGVPTVIGNVTVTEPTARNYLTAWPSGAARPEASNLNYVLKQTVL